MSAEDRHFRAVHHTTHKAIAQSGRQRWLASTFEMELWVYECGCLRDMHSQFRLCAYHRALQHSLDEGASR